MCIPTNNYHQGWKNPNFFRLVHWIFYFLIQKNPNKTEWNPTVKKPCGTNPNNTSSCITNNYDQHSANGLTFMPLPGYRRIFFSFLFFSIVAQKYVELVHGHLIWPLARNPNSISPPNSIQLINSTKASKNSTLELLLVESLEALHYIFYYYHHFVHSCSWKSRLN